MQTFPSSALYIFIGAVPHTDAVVGLIERDANGFILSWVIISLADLIFLLQFVYIFLKRFLPAIRNQVALELSEDGITDFTRNIVIDWADVKNIDMQLGRNFSKMIIDLKEETDYGTQIAISLRWVAGRDIDICNTTQAYFEEMTKLR